MDQQGEVVAEAARTPEEALRALALTFVTAYNNRDIETIIAILDPNIIQKPSRAVADSVQHGHAEVRAWWADRVQTGLFYSLEIADALVLDTPIAVPSDPRAVSGRVGVFGEICLEGESFGPWAAVYVIVDGLVTEAQSYLSSRSMLEDLGIVPKDPVSDDVEGATP